MSALAGVRIVFVVPSGQLGGAERQALLLARYFRSAKDADVRIWGLDDGGSAMNDLCRAAGIEWHPVPLPPPGDRVHQVTAVVRFIHALRRVQPDILLPYSRVPNRVCGLFWRWTGAGLCVWNHRSGATDPVPLRVDRWAARRTPLFVANSHHGAQYLVRAYGLAQPNVHVVHNGVELEPPRRSREEWRRAIDVSDSAFVACMVANLTRNKDHAMLLRAWQQVRARMADQNRDAVLLLAGEFGDRYESLTRLAEQLHLQSSVRFLGQITDVSGLLQSVDVGVFASVMEGSPNGVLECMAAGLPVVGTDIAGIREAVGPDGEPWLAPVGDHERFADLILRFADDPDRRERVGRANARRIEDCFSARQLGERMASLCAGHVARRRERRVRVPTAREIFFSPAPDHRATREAQERAFFHAIKNPNGTNRTTYARRLESVDAVVNALLPRDRVVEIMDVGISSGVTTLDWMDALDRARIDHRMTASDVCTRASLVSFGPRLNVLVDPGGYPLQFDLLGRAIPYPIGVRRTVLCPPLWLLAQGFRWALPRRMPALRDRATEILLVSPELIRRGVRVVEDDLLVPGAFAGAFDVVRAANVLNRTYFDDDTLVAMSANLCARLKPDGLLVVCSTDEREVNHGTIFRVRAPGQIEVVARTGEGSAVETLVIDALPVIAPRASPA